MGSSIEDAIRRNFTSAGTVAERQIPGNERPNAVESTNLRQRVRRVSAQPSEV